MALSAAEKAKLTEIAGGIRTCASWVSGARSNRLTSLAEALQEVAGGDAKLADLEVPVATSPAVSLPTAGGDDAPTA